MNLENVSTGKDRKTKSILMIGIVLAVFAVACLAMSGAVSAADDSSAGIDEEWKTVTTVDELKNAVASGGNVRLGATISMGGQLDIKNNVVLDLNGCELRFRGKWHIYVAPEGDLTINDSSNPSTGKIMGGYSSGSGGCIFVGGGGKLTLNNGTIRDGIAKNNGGGVYVDHGTFTMNGGVIRANDSGGHATLCDKGHGGGVYMNGGTFVMKDGRISNNGACDNGAGVFLNNGAEFTMEGGIIYHNGAADNGGGIYLCNGSTFTMTGGEISENDASAANGGGVFVKNSTFTMNGGTISNNCAYNYGGGVCVDTGAKFTMNDGTISENRIYYDDGAGVCVLKGGKFIMTDGTIEKNKAYGFDSHKSYGGGVYVQGGEFEMTDGTVKENEVENDGGGIFVCENGKMTIGGSATITGNTKLDDKTVTNVGLDSGGTLTLDGNLSGEIRICSPNPKEGAEFGIAITGASGAENILSEDGKLHGKIDDGKLVWTNNDIWKINDDDIHVRA